MEPFSGFQPATSFFIFSQKNTKIDCPAAYFNKTCVAHTFCQKHLGMNDERLNFDYCAKEKIAEVNKCIGIICKLANMLLRDSFVTINKSLVQPHLD